MIDHNVEWPYENFTKKEFACKCPRDCEQKDGGLMDPEFMRDLQIVREVYDEVMTVTSGLRCPWWNEKEGGKDDSAHLTGNGADLSCTRSRQRSRMRRALDTLFTRMGLHKVFIHIDNLRSKAQDVLWIY